MRQIVLESESPSNERLQTPTPHPCF